MRGGEKQVNDYQTKAFIITLNFLVRVCVSPVTLSLPVRLPRLPGSVITTGLAPPPPSPCALPPGTSWGRGNAWHTPGTTRCSPAVPVLGFPGRPRGQRRGPVPGRVLLASRTPRTEAAGAPGSRRSSGAVPGPQLAWASRAVRREQTSRRPPATPPSTPPTSGAPSLGGARGAAEEGRGSGARGTRGLAENPRPRDPYL